MKVLVIDNTLDPHSWGSEQICRFVRKVPSATLYVRRAPQEDLPADPRTFDRIVVSGSRTSAIDRSPWIAQLDGFIRETVDAGVPYFGICFGHQSLIRAIGGEECVSNGTSPEYGWSLIRKTTESRFFHGIGDEFYSFSVHSDEVKSLPAGVKLIARSDACAIQACELEGKPVFSVQFHPEKTLSDTEISMKRDFPKGRPVLNRSQGARLYDAGVGEALFSNFLVPK